MEVVASLSEGRTAAAQCGLFTYKSVPVIFEQPCSLGNVLSTCVICCCVYVCYNIVLVLILHLSRRLLGRGIIVPAVNTVFRSTCKENLFTSFCRMKSYRFASSLCL